MTKLEWLMELEAKATKGPWDVDCLDEGIRHLVRNVGHACDCLGPGRYDGGFIATMRNSLPHLLAVAEAAKKIHGQEIKFEEADYFAMRPELMDELLSALAALEEEAKG